MKHIKYYEGTKNKLYNNYEVNSPIKLESL